MMGLFKRKSQQNVLIVGCGRLGSSLANILSEQNKNVTIIDIDAKAFRKLSSSFGGLSLEGDGSDIDHLMYADANQADVLIAATDDDDTNIMIGQIARQVFGIEIVLVRLYDTSKQVAFENLGIISICPANLSIDEIKRHVMSEELKAV
jgi:trk system potassium uptake protein TrkA